MKIEIYKISNDFFEIVVAGENSNGELFAEGEHTEVLQSVDEMLQSSALDFGETGFYELGGGSNIVTVEEKNKWLLIEVEPLKRARIMNVPRGTTQTKLKTWEGSLPEVINALYNYINSI